MARSYALCLGAILEHGLDTQPARRWDHLSILSPRPEAATLSAQPKRSGRRLVKGCDFARPASFDGLGMLVITPDVSSYACQLSRWNKDGQEEEG